MAVKRRSAARTSRRSPRARNVASGHGGSARPATTRRIPGGRCSTKNVIASWIEERVDHVVVVDHDDDSCSSACNSFSSVVIAVSVGVSGDCSIASEEEPTAGATVRSAATT